MGKKELTLEIFTYLLQGEIFARGVTTDNVEGVNMSNSGKQLRWVAVKGWREDWCIYIHWATSEFDYVSKSGDKVINEVNIRKLIPCSDEVFQLYRK